MTFNTFQEAVYDAARTGICAAANSVQGGYDTLGPLAGPGGAVGNRLAREVAQNYCGTPGPGPVEPGFEGGQCPGVGYSLSGSVISRNVDGSGTNTIPISGSVVGPISVEIESVDDPRRWTFRVVGQNNSTGFFTSGGSNLTDFDSYDLVPARIDGQPDNCGDPPIPPPTGAPIAPVSAPVTYINNEGNETTVNVNLTFAPAYIDANLDIKVPVTVDVNPDIRLRGEVNLNGDLNVNFGGSSLRPDSAGDPGQGDPPPEENRCVKAVYLAVVPLPGVRATELFRDGSTPLYAPRLAQLFFTADFGGAPYRSQAFNIQKVNSVIAAPEGLCWTGFELALEPEVAVNFAAGIYDSG